MKYFKASFATVLIRFYIMIAVALIAGFASIPWLGILCVPIFLSAMLGVQFEFGTSNKTVSTSKRISSKPTMSTVNEAA